MAQMPTSSDTRIAAAIATGVAALDALNGALDQLAKLAGPNSEGFSFDTAIPALTISISINQIGERASAAVQLLQTLSRIKNTTLLPDTELSELASRAGEMKTHADRLATSVSEFMSGGTTTSLEVTSLSASNSAGQSVNFGQLVAAIYGPSQSLLTSVRKFLIDRDSVELKGLSDAIAEIATIRSGLRSSVANIAGVQRTISKTEKNAQAATQVIEQHRQQAEELAAESKKLRDSLVVNYESATAQVKNVATTNAEAKVLKQAVADYQEEFDKFESAMTLREQQFTKGTQTTEEMHKALTDITAELEKLVKRSRSVLGEATVAGLSDRFKTEADSLNRRMGWVLLMLFIGVALFFFSAGVALDLFPFLSGWVSIPIRIPPVSEGPWQNLVYLLTNVLGKVMFLLPALVLIAFSVKWYAALFRLRKEYAYKYTVAASLPGFKVEAPSFAEAVTAIAFQELLSNESDEMTEQIKANKGAAETLLQKLTNPFVSKVVEQAIAKMSKEK